MRPGVSGIGRQANTSIGRFLRLFMKKCGGSADTARDTDKATIGETFKVALAENEDAVTELGWESFSVSRGFKPRRQRRQRPECGIRQQRRLPAAAIKPRTTWTHSWKYLAEPCRPASYGSNWGKFFPLW